MPEYKLKNGDVYSFTDDEQDKVKDLLADYPDAEEISKKVTPTNTDAVVEVDQASDTDSTLASGSSGLYDRKSMTGSNTYYDKLEQEKTKQTKENKKKAKEAYGTLQDRLLNISQEQVDEQFINDYFKLDQRPVVTTTKSTGILPGQVEYENNPMPIKEYLSPEKFAEYEQALAGEPIIGSDSDEQAEIAETKTEARNNVRKKIQEQYLGSLSTDIKEVIENDKDFDYSFIGAEAFVKDTKSKTKQIELDRNKNIEKYNSEIESYNTQFDNIQSQLDVLIKNSNGGVLTVDKAGNPNATPATVIEYNKLIGEAQILQDQYKNSELDLLYDGVVAQGELINFNVDQINNKIQEVKDQSLLEASLKKDYTFSAAAGRAIEEFFAGSAVNFASLTAQLGLESLKIGEVLNVPTPGVGLSLKTLGVDFSLNDLNQEKVNNAISYVKKQTFDYNKYLREKREKNIPDAPTLDDIKSQDVTFANWFTRAFADNSPSMLVSFIPGGTGLATAAATRTAVGYAAKKAALQSQKNFMQASMRTVQGTFFTAETGSKFKEIEESPTSNNYTLSQKAFNSISSGLTAMYAETLGQTQMLAQGRKFIKNYGTRKFKKEAYDNINGFTKNVGVKLGLSTSGVILKGAGINTAEESLTLLGQNALDIVVLGEDKSILEGLNKDFFAQQLVASFGLSAPQALGGTMNILKNEFITRDEVIKNQGYVKDLVKVDEQLNNYKGDKRSSEYRGFKNQKNEIITKLAIADSEVLQKLNSLSIDQIEKVADLKRQMRLINSEAQGLGQSGLSGKDVNEARARLETQYRALDKQYNSILNTKNKNMAAFEAVTAEKLGEGFVNTNAAYYFGLFNFQKDAALTMSSKNSQMLAIENDTKTTDESLEDYTLQQKLKILKGRDDGENATFIFNPKTKTYDIILYEDNIRSGIGATTILADAKFAAGAALHELAHIRNIEKSIVNKNGELSEEGKEAVNEMINVLKENKALSRLNITEADYNAIIRRFEAVKNSKAGKEEVMIALSDAALLGMIDINDIKNYMPKSNDFVKNLINELLGDNGYLAQINTPEDVFNYVKQYQKDIIARKVVMDTEPDEEQNVVDNELGFSISNLDNKLKQYDNDPKKLVRNMLTYPLSKSEYAKETGAINEAITKRLYDPILPDKKKLLTRDEFLDALIGESATMVEQEYDGSQSLDKFVSNRLNLRANSLAKRLGIEQEIKTEISDAKGITVNPEPEPETTMPTESKLRRDLKIDEKLIKKIKDAVRKTLGTKLPSIESPEFKQALKKAFRTELKVPLANLLGTRTKYRTFLEENFEDIYDAIPQETLNKRFKQFIEATGKREKTAQGNAVFNKRKINKQEFVDYFLGPDVGRSTKGTRKDALAESLGEIMALDATMEVAQEPDIKTKREEIAKLQGQKVTPTDKAKIALTLNRDPELKFSPGLRKIFNLPLKGRSKVNTLLKEKGLNETLDLKKDILTESGRKKILDNFKYIMTFGPKDMWFGPRGGSVFTTSGKDYDVSMTEFRKDGSKNPKWTKEKSDALKELRQDLIDYSKSDDAVFGKPIKGVTDYKLSSYSTLLGNAKNAAIKNKNGDIKSFNDKVSKIHKEMWNRFNEAIKSDKNNASKIATYLKLVANHTGHWHKLGAEIVGWSTNPKGKNGTLYEYEHAMPATAAYLYLLDTAIDKGNFDLSYQAVMDNYKLIALDKAENAKLGKAGLSTGMPKGWFLGDNFWWQRYFNPEVAAIEGGIPPNSIMMDNGRLMGNQLGVDVMGRRTNETIEASKKLVSKKNNKILPKNLQLKGDFTNQMVLDKMAEVDNINKEEALKFSKGTDLSKQFNDIIENKTGIGTDKRYAKVKARVAGAGKGQFNFFVPPSAEDFVGLLYKTLGKGKKGDAQMAWYKVNLLDPFARAMNDLNRDRLTLLNDYKALKKDLKIVPKNLRKKIPGEPFTREQAVRVYIWDQQGMSIPGLSQTDLKELTKYVNDNADLKIFGDQLLGINKGDPYNAPKNEGWTAGDISSDLLEGLRTTKRAKYLELWQQNVDQIFSETNLNKLEAAFGESYRGALENILYRMKTGRNRTFGKDGLVNRATDWLTNSVGAIMFFNTRSAILQTISSINFINWSDNNILQAGKAFANMPQYKKDFVKLMNSPFLLARRDGLKMNVNEADIADMAKDPGSMARRFIAKTLRLGFLPTQIADSFAIASGGATFYRNRIKKYMKEGMNQQAAEKQAMIDFTEIAETSQQSSRPDKISEQQAGGLGRVILAFANTPMQYTREIKKAALDLKNGRGDAKTNISKIIYYGFVQNLIFNALQSALFMLMFDDEEELTQKELEKKETKDQKKYLRVLNSMSDQFLRGIGVGGAIISTLKNTTIRLLQQSEKSDPEYAKNAIIELAQVSPPLGSKFRKINTASNEFEWNKEEMKNTGWSLDNPAYLAGANIVSAMTNLPADRVVKKIDNLRNASNSDLETYKRIASFGGWSRWDLDIKKPKPATIFPKKISTRKIGNRKIGTRKIN